ncbi:hypothetical protein [Gordonia sputi]
MKTSTFIKTHMRPVAAAVLTVSGIASVILAVDLGSTLAHADEPDSTSASAATDRIGVLSINELDTSGATVTGAIVQIERITDNTPHSANSTTTSEPSSATSSTSETSTTSSSATATAPDSHVRPLTVPVGTAFDVVTTTNPVVVALPEGSYTLTSLGVTSTPSAPPAPPLTVHVDAGKQADGTLTQPASSTSSTSTTTPTPTN